MDDWKVFYRHQKPGDPMPSSNDTQNLELSDTSIDLRQSLKNISKFDLSIYDEHKLIVMGVTLNEFHIYFLPFDHGVASNVLSVDPTKDVASPTIVKPHTSYQYKWKWGPTSPPMTGKNDYILVNTLDMQIYTFRCLEIANSPFSGCIWTFSIWTQTSSFQTGDECLDSAIIRPQLYFLYLLGWDTLLMARDLITSTVYGEKLAKQVTPLTGDLLPFEASYIDGKDFVVFTDQEVYIFQYNIQQQSDALFYVISPVWNCSRQDYFYCTHNNYTFPNVSTPDGYLSAVTYPHQAHLITNGNDALRGVVSSV